MVRSAHMPVIARHTDLQDQGEYVITVTGQLKLLPVSRGFCIHFGLFSFLWLLLTGWHQVHRVWVLFYFPVQSLRSDWDTARLPLLPKSRPSPGLISYQINLANESPVFTFLEIFSLLPGTVSTEKKGDEITIHVLNLNSFNRADIDDCQLEEYYRMIPDK